MTLARKELIRPTRLELPGEAGVPHSDTSSSATPPTSALPKQVRAELHERFADWLDRRRPRPRSRSTRRSSAITSSRLTAYRAELGPLDEHALGLGRRAAECLATAGRRALARGDAHAATNLARARPCSCATDRPVWPRAARDVTDALILAGNFAASRPGDDGGDRGRRRFTPWPRRLAHARRHSYIHRARRQPRAPTRRRRAIALPELEKARDDNGLARAWAAIAWTHHIAMRFEAAIDAFERAFTHARRAGDERQAESPR